MTKCAVWIEYNVIWQEKRHSALDLLQAEKNLWRKFTLINIPEKLLCVLILMNICLNPVVFFFFLLLAFFSFFLLYPFWFFYILNILQCHLLKICLAYRLIISRRLSTLYLDCIRAFEVSRDILIFLTLTLQNTVAVLSLLFQQGAGVFPGTLTMLPQQRFQPLAVPCKERSEAKVSFW